MQDICKRQRYWWRRGYLTFPLVVGQPLYTLNSSLAGLSPASALTEIAIEEITKFSILLSPNPYQTAEFVPVFDPETLIDMINNTALTSPTIGNLTGQPGGRYTIDGNSSNVLRIDPPDAAYQASMVFWAMADPGTDSATDAVPLIPSWGHNTIVAGINAKIFKFAYGSKNEKTLDAQMEYEQGLQDLMSKRQFDPNYRSQLSLSEDAVRST